MFWNCLVINSFFWKFVTDKNQFSHTFEIGIPIQSPHSGIYPCVFIIPKVDILWIATELLLVNELYNSLRSHNL